jgi:hypothetical protein
MDTQENSLDKTSDPKPTTQYFAAKDASDCASTLLKRASSFYQILQANAYLEKIKRMWQFYHGEFYNSSDNGHRVSFTGETGELTAIPINHFRNIAKHMLTIITSNRPVMDARAVNTDYKSQSQTYIAQGILEYYMREKRLEECLIRSVEYAIVLGAGYIKLEWNATEGELYDVDEETGQFNYQGDIVFSNLSPFDVVVDGTKDSWNNEWVLVRTFQNKYNLMAKYPEIASKIESIPSTSDISRYRLNYFTNDETDDIPVYEFYHKRTEALQNGRYMLFLDDNLILLDTKLPYREIPIFRIVGSEIMGTPYGYAPMFDIYPIQEGINSLYSTIMTNQATFGVQNVFVPRGADITVASLSGGLNVIEANAKPEAINLTQTPAEIFKFLEILIQSAETISGINSVARGNPEASLRSGNALALVQSMAIQFVSGLQQNYVKLIEETGTSLINILKDFAAAPRVVQIVGKNNRPYLKEFSGEDLSSISRVIVDMGNPLSRTTAGRVQMAEQLLQMKLLKNPEQYFSVINTGRLDVTFQGDQQQLLLIQRENEKMMSGEQVIALGTDLHSIHITEHTNVLNDPDLRTNHEYINNVNNHISEHLNFLRTVDPGLLQVLHQQPLPPLPPPAPEGMGVPEGGAMPTLPGMPEPMPAGMMQPPGGMEVPGNPVGPAGQKKTNTPNLPQLDAQNLVNPALQEATTGNVRDFPSFFNKQG